MAIRRSRVGFKANSTAHAALATSRQRASMRPAIKLPCPRQLSSPLMVRHQGTEGEQRERSGFGDDGDPSFQRTRRVAARSYDSPNPRQSKLRVRGSRISPPHRIRVEPNEQASTCALLTGRSRIQQGMRPGRPRNLGGPCRRRHRDLRRRSRAAPRARRGRWWPTPTQRGRLGPQCHHN